MVDESEPNYDPERGTYSAGAEPTLASLRREMTLHFQAMANELDEIKEHVAEGRAETRALNGRVRTEERWTAYVRGALAVLVALGVGNALVLVFGG